MTMLRMARAAPDLMRDGQAMLLSLKNAGVPVLWQTSLDRLEGDGRVQQAVAGNRRWDVDIVALNTGFQPETGLARALGAPHRFVGWGASGFLATIADAEGRTGLPTVFAVGDGASFAGARVAQARGRLAGLAAARDLGFAAPPDPDSRTALARAEAFQTALWQVFAAPPREVPDETIVCRCEEVTASRLRQEMAAGLTSVAALKKATRAGMGRCQGRFCAATIAAMCPQAPDAEGFAAPRAPLRPVPAAPLMHEAPEFVAPLLPDPAPAQVLHPMPPLPVEVRQADIVVIGGGVAGLSTAYFLARDGADVLLIDRDEAAMAASTANAGSLHVQLLSYDFTDDTPPDGGPAAHTLPLAPRSIALWKEIGAAFGEDLGIRTNGGLMLAEDEAGLDWLRRKSAMENRFGIESHVLSHNELRDLAPAVSERMIGADFVPAEGYGDPLRGMMALRSLAQSHGARLLRGAEVQAIDRDGATWPVTTSKGAVTAGNSRQRHRALGRSDWPDGWARPAGDGDGAAGDRYRAGAGDDPASGGGGKPAFVAEAAGERQLPDRRRLVRRLRRGDRADADVAAEYRGQSVGLRKGAAGGEVAVDPARLDRDQPGDRPSAAAGRGAGSARILQRGHRERLHAGTSGGADRPPRRCCTGRRLIRATGWSGLERDDRRRNRRRSELRDQTKSVMTGGGIAGGLNHAIKHTPRAGWLSESDVILL